MKPSNKKVPLNDSHKTILNEVLNLKETIEYILDGCDQYYGPFNEAYEFFLEPDEDEQDTVIWNRLKKTLDHLELLSGDIAFLKSKIVEGPCPLHMRNDGKWETPSGHAFSCGYPIEYWFDDDSDSDETGWRRSRVEHRYLDDIGGSYYVFDKKIPLYEGMLVRVRE